MKQLSIILLAVLLISPVISAEKTLNLRQAENALNVKEKAFDGFRFELDLAEITLDSRVAGGNFYTSLSAPGYIRDFTLEGYPALPVVTRLIEIPEGAGVVITIGQVQRQVINLGQEGFTNPLIPEQPSVSKSDDPDKVPFVKEARAYARDEFSRQKLVRVEEIGRMRGVRIARLVISPFRYNPVSNLLEITTDIDATVSFEGADLAATQALRKKYYSPFFETTFNALINHGPETIGDTSGIYPIKYVIVSSPAFQAALQPFVEWKTKMGYNVIEAYTNNPSVGTTTTSIKAYLQGLFNAASSTDPAPTFVLFVGDVAQVPSFAGTTGSHPSDLYYCEYDGGGDYLPELFYGRFSANNLTELQPQIDKTLEYEQYLMPSTSFLSEVVMVAGMDSYYAATHGNGQINYGTSLYFNSSHGLVSHNYLYPTSGSSASTIISKISDGVGFANYTAHCGTSGWSDPSFTSSNVASLQNTSEYPLIIGNCCLSNKFDGDCFGETLLRANGKGALGYIGGSNSTLWDEDFYWSVGVGTPIANPTYAGTSLGAYDRLFHENGEPRSEWYETNGQIIAAGNLAVSASASNEDKYYWEIYHLMGDPSLRTYMGVPSALQVTHQTFLPVGSPSITISTEPDVYVGITYNGMLTGAGKADSTGNMIVSLQPMNVPGYAYIVATKQNRQPYIDSILVAAPNGPYVGLNDYIPNDQAGNANGLVDFGESILLDVALENFGNQDAGQVSALISTNDPYISLTDSTELFTVVAAGDTTTIQGAFGFTVGPLVPDQHSVKLSIALTDTAGGIWTYDFYILLNAPDLKIVSMDIDDQVSGNGNGSVDPGETVDIIANIANNGHCDANATSAVLTTFSPVATVTNGSASPGNLSPGTQTQVVFQAEISSTAVNGDIAEFHCQVTSGLYDDLALFAPAIGEMVEDWETGNFTQFPWLQGGDAPWTISSGNAWEGTYCAASGSIGNDQATSMEIEVNVLMADSIYFYRKVSSEQGYDYLRFSIDGNELEQWSGTESWARVGFPVTAGLHTFKWTYQKDWYVASGSDKAWIDYIEFPAIAGMATDIKDPEFQHSLDVYPNPASDRIHVNIFLPESDDVHITLLDETGREIELVKNGPLNAGHHGLEINGEHIVSGVYYLLVKGQDFRLTERVVIIH